MSKRAKIDTAQGRHDSTGKRCNNNVNKIDLLKLSKTDSTKSGIISKLTALFAEPQEPSNFSARLFYHILNGLNM